MEWRNAFCVVYASTMIAAATACDTRSEKAAPKPSSTVSSSGADQDKKEPQVTPAMARDEPIDRGKYLVTIAGCNDCHSPKKMTPKGPQPDPTRLLSGHPADEKLTPAPKLAARGSWQITSTAGLTAWSGPWGETFAANLTPDPESGLGNWTQAQFIQAIRTGKHLGSAGSRDILPPMPWSEYAQMTDADLSAIFAYLRSVPPVKNMVPSAMPRPQPPTPSG